MFKSVEDIISSISSNWNKDNIDKDYSFMDDLNDFRWEFSKVSEEVTKYHKTKVELITLYTLQNVYNILEELITGIVVGQRISINQFNRSIIENFITLSFILKYGEQAAEVSIANGEIAFQLFVKKVNPKMTKLELSNVNKIIKDTREKYDKYNFDITYKWTNAFLGRKIDKKTSLFDLAKNLSLLTDYKRLGLFHQQVHSSSALSHYMNQEEYYNHKVYISKILSAIEYCSKTLKLVAKESQLKSFEKIEDNLILKFEKLLKKT